MAVVVPATDAVNNLLQAQIATVQALVTANANPAVQPALISALDALQMQLVVSLISNNLARAPGGGMASNNKPSFLSASGIIAAGTINT